MSDVRKSSPAADARVTRHSRDLVIELRRAEIALKKARTIAARLGRALAAIRKAGKPRVTRHSRDL